ncbi:phage repressor protein/antirepressor Ant [Bacillus thuringiensis serovar roskildiensis]|uniref:Phage repressor protein/antirepressor Ant n=1 Tax=Bacillus thuringiensis serovar sooncheon TaxID=180891 RepID=A0A9Q5SF80_BACTU|nr:MULTISPECIES: BRO family protein [Bacillus]MDC7973878.1 BRO family protein [Bacillus sp. BLCC-B18]OTW67887.1 phage repressor protein/antirepressor Ant [Bacillus thuringiensis serovar coreanensis]OTX44504.1 phage repressor protein/antirepressor Ant [Bacillus thuringiensis serovar sooncheon]OTX53667.1 phage repressor protein/antirepressor Ant [Bacillus thuringiensis serovar guiyangiensis]OTX67987.1 phage repressor protein/antirepressor Ant [Bacillus thuringiensis serovar roskildiensis]
MNNLQVFDHEELGQVRTTKEDGAIWFVAKDVCEVLGISKYRDALARLDEDETGTVLVDTPGGIQNMGAINESGLYSLILASRKPQAKAFKKWVTSEVLPSIRRDGGYMVANEEESDDDLLARALVVAQATIVRKNKKLAQVEAQLEEQAPAVAYHDKVLDIEGYTTIESTAKQLGLRSPQQLNQMLKQAKIIHRTRKGSWLHTAKYAYLREEGHINYKPLIGGKLQMLVSQRGTKEIAKLLGLIEQ